MSGVAKDELDPVANEEITASAPVVDETSDSVTDPISDGGAPRSDAADPDTRNLRRTAPHLRVVSDNDPVDAGYPEPALRLGAVMRLARENLGLTLEQVSKDTRIHLTHLRAVEDMLPNLLGAPVYAKGYIRNYARHLKMDPDATLARYLSECAILADPEKQEIAPPATARRLPLALPVLGILVVSLVVGGTIFLFMNDGPQPSGTTVARPVVPPAEVAAGPVIEAPALRLVALKRARVEVRGSDGTKFVARYFSPGESYSPRVNAGWTVTTEDGTAFEWRLGEASLGPLSALPGPVYAQSVDSALGRTPVVVETTTPTTPAPAVSDPLGRPSAPTPAGRPAAVSRPATAPSAAASTTAPVIGAPPRPMPTEPTPAADATDPSLLAYPAN